MRRRGPLRNARALAIDLVGAVRRARANREPRVRLHEAADVSTLDPAGGRARALFGAAEAMIEAADVARAAAPDDAHGAESDAEYRQKPANSGGI